MGWYTGMILTNNEIYNYAINLVNWKPEIKFPIKVNFFLQKNIQTILSAAQEIEIAKTNIAKEYGDLVNDCGTYLVPEERRSAAARDLAELFSISQDIQIHKLKLNDFENIELTLDQLAPIFFMIEE